MVGHSSHCLFETTVGRGRTASCNNSSDEVAIGYGLDTVIRTHGRTGLQYIYNARALALLHMGAEESKPFPARVCSGSLQMQEVNVPCASVQGNCIMALWVLLPYLARY